MYRKLSAFLILIVSCFAINAQQSAGQWTIYPVIGLDYDKIIDTENKVYFLSSASLYSFDKQTDETYFYNSENKLSSNSITDIFYNHDKKYLVIVYEDYNLDMLYDDGTCYVLPDIKDANIIEDKNINDIAFGSDRFVVATNFGIVVYDDNKCEVIESGIYDIPVDNVAISGDNLIVYTPYSIYFSKLSARHNSLDKFTKVSGADLTDLYVVNEKKFVWTSKDKLVITTAYYDKNDVSNETTSIAVNSKIQRFKDGFYFKSGNNIVVYDNDVNQLGSYPIPADLASAAFSLWDGVSSVWLGSKQGSANFDLSSSQPVVLSDWYRPESITCKEVAYFFMSPDGNRIYLSNLGPTIIRKYLTQNRVGGSLTVFQTTNVIENGSIRDVSIVNASASVATIKNYQKAFNSTAMFGGVTRLAEDPNNSEIYYIGNGQEGLYVVKGNEEIYKFDLSNAPFFVYWNTRVYDVNFDPEGNMWVGHDHMNKEYSPYLILPAKSLKKDYSKITKEEWINAKIEGMAPQSADFISLFSKKSNYAAFISANGYTMHLLDTKGTYSDPSDDKNHVLKTHTDQDGNTISPQYYFSMVEDRDGRLWIGTNSGIFYYNLAAGFNEYSTIVRPKVPRNDGTNYADFLLDSDQINDIAVDPSNRKWIATDFSGVFLVSADGDKILKHFDSSNSPLPSNRVVSVICDPHSNVVYFGTTNGMLSYKADSAPAKDDYSEVYAYPNPVKPDYTDWITIAGLMDNSLVKITDAAGNVFFQTRSEGGMVTWDGCNAAGERVRSGIYYVYASTGADGVSANGVVTKIMVIN